MAAGLLGCCHFKTECTDPTYCYTCVSPPRFTFT